MFIVSILKTIAMRKAAWRKMLREVTASDAAYLVHHGLDYEREDCRRAMQFAHGF